MIRLICRSSLANVPYAAESGFLRLSLFLAKDQVSDLLVRVARIALIPLAALTLGVIVLDVEAQSSDVQTDRDALVALYDATNGDDWTFNTNWLSDAPLGDWYGVNTNASGRVVSVYLKGRGGLFGQAPTPHGLSGHLPEELGNLSHLSTLNLGINNLRGSIPESLGKLERLTQLNLEDNDFSGHIPVEIGDLSRLTSLRLANNQLSGPIPTELGSLERLTFLDLSGNEFLGQIPSELGNLTRLTVLLLNNNNLFGEIPPTIGQLTELRRLTLGSNSLSGEIGQWIGNLDKLNYLSVFDNNLNGEIPSTIGNLVDLVELDLSRNRLSGSLPDEVSALAELEYLDVSRNELNGRINPQLTKLNQLSYLNLSNNKLTGPVISGLRHLPNLQILYLANNNLSGPVPTRFVDSPNIFLFSIAGNLVCVPGTHSFIFWLGNVALHDISALRFCNATDRSILDQLYDETSGDTWTNNVGWADNELALERWYGIETDDLGRVVSIDLGNNDLEGTLPLGLGSLSQLKELNLEGNMLTGRLPLSLRRLDLDVIQFSDTNLCVPQEMGFQAWLDTSVTHAGSGLSCDLLTQQDVMTMFFAETKGSTWTEATNWLTSEPLEDWHGVDVDANGNVTALRIPANNLSGTIPLELVRLPQLRTVNLEGNALSGTIPPEFGNLTHLNSIRLGLNQLYGDLPAELGSLENLSHLDLSFNRLTGGIPAELGNLGELETLNLSGNGLSGTIPTEIGQLTNLKQLRLAFNELSGNIPREIGGMRELTTLELQGNVLSGTIPAEIGNLSRLESLWLYFNDFSGEIPPEIGNLANLEILNLIFNRLSDKIPTELGNLTNLEGLYLSSNKLNGDIPAELGNLSNLNFLVIDFNRLSGSIPSELGNLSGLAGINLQENELSGEIPDEFGDLTELQSLELNGNDLSGNLPKSLGSLSALEGLYLHDNDLEGSIPKEYRGLTELRFLTLSHNAKFSGPIPIELTDLKHIEVFLTVGTDICLPTDQAFSDWLTRVYKRRIRSCASSGPLVALLTQPVQSHEYPVPLVAGEQALLRIFPADANEVANEIPDIRARFYQDDQETYVANVPARVLSVPTLVDPGNLASSSNVEIPGTVIQPGLELEIEFGSGESDSATIELDTQTSKSERVPVEVQVLPDFDLTLIPFVWSGSNDRSIIDVVNEMASNPQEHALLEETRTLLPIAGLKVTAHEPVTSTTNNAFELLLNTMAIRTMEGGTGHYMGMMTDLAGSTLGIGFIEGQDSVSLPRSDTIAHEFGHNLSLRHAPCGGAGGPDPSYPTANGSLGSWGYDFRDGGSVVPPTAPDLMTYCRPRWISDYHFTNALRYRLFRESLDTTTVAAATKTLLVWGRKYPSNEIVLNPSFVVDAPPKLPESDGAFELSVGGKSGDPLFSLSFDMQEIGDGEGHSSFVFLIPIQLDWEYQLDSVALDGPSGSVTLDLGKTAPMSLIRNPHTQQVLGILKHSQEGLASDVRTIVEDASDRGLEVLFSRGMPETAEWRR